MPLQHSTPIGLDRRRSLAKAPRFSFSQIQALPQGRASGRRRRVSGGPFDTRGAGLRQGEDQLGGQPHAVLFPSVGPGDGHQRSIVLPPGHVAAVTVEPSHATPSCDSVGRRRRSNAGRTQPRQRRRRTRSQSLPQTNDAARSTTCCSPRFSARSRACPANVRALGRSSPPPSRHRASAQASSVRASHPGASLR